MEHAALSDSYKALEAKFQELQKQLRGRDLDLQNLNLSYTRAILKLDAKDKELEELSWKERADIIHRTVARGLKHYTEEDARFMALFTAGEAGELAMALMIAAKVGEVCNQVKKDWMETFGVAKSQGDRKEHVRMELADVRISLELLSKCLEVDLDKACEDKLSICEKRWPEAGQAVALEAKTRLSHCHVGGCRYLTHATCICICDECAEARKADR